VLQVVAHVRHLGHISSNIKGSFKSHRNSYQRTLFATCDIFQQIIKEPMRKRQGVGQIPFDRQLKKGSSIGSFWKAFAFLTYALASTARRWYWWFKSGCII
jgi:hypothetical protein